MGISKEKSFPRGGAPFKKSINHDNTKFTKTKELFSTSKTQEGAQRNKNKKKLKKAKEGEDSLKVKSVEPLTYDKLSSGLKTLARISEIKGLELKLSLPGRLVAHVPITKISQPYTEALRKVTEGSSEDDIEIKTLDDMYQIGQLVICSIVEVDSDNDFHRVTATLYPNQVNDHAFDKGHVVMAAVKSVEDHGYEMDVGKSNRRAFLSHKKKSQKLSVGQVVPCCVTKMEKNSVVLNATKLGNVWDECKDLTVHQMFPGMRVQSKVASKLKNGTEVAFGDFKAFCHVSFQSDNGIEVGQDVTATILYVLPTVNHIYISLQNNLDFGKSNEASKSHLVGDLVKDCDVVEIDNRGLILNMLDSATGVVPFRHLNDELKPGSKTAVSAKYLKTKVQVRVLQFDLFEEIFVCSMRKSNIENALVRLDSLVPGATLTGCKIKKFAPKGVVVEVAKNLDGFIPFLHLSDVPLKHPERKFSVGDKLKCRVLKVDPSKRRLHLTSKKLLVEQDYPIVDDFDSHHIGKVTEGVVVQATHEGVLLQLFGETCGWVPKSRISVEQIEYPEKLFFMGQVLKCKVLEVDEAKRKMILTLILTEEKLKPLGSKQKKAIDGIKKGQIYEDIIVCDVTSEGLAVEVGNGIKALIPKNHLTDNIGMADVLLQSYQVGDSIPKALCFERDVLPILTMKSSILAFESSQITFDDIHEGQIIPTVVSNVKSYGVFVKLPIWKVPKSALIPLRMLSDTFIDDPTDFAAPHQTLIAKVVEKHSKDQKLTMTSKMSSTNHDESPRLFSLFRDMDRVQAKNGPNYQVGDVVNCKVQEVTEFGLDTLIEDEQQTRGLCPMAGLQGLEAPIKGQTVAGVVIFVDSQFGVVELSIQPDIIKKTLLRAKKLPKNGLAVKAVCVLKRSCLDMATFCVKSPNQFRGHFVHCPMQSEEQFELHRTYDLQVVGSSEHRLIGVEVASKKRKRSSSFSLSEAPKNEPEAEQPSPVGSKKAKKATDAEIPPEVREEDPGWSEDFNPWGTDILVPKISTEPSESPSTLPEAKEKVKTHLSKKEKKELEKLEELAIHRAEKRVIEGEDLPPESSEEFDRLVLTCPDSSLVWIQYIAFHLERKEFELARGVVKRALEKINFREEKEKFNIYMAWFNLENAYGTKEAADKVYKEALQCNDEFLVLSKAAEILVQHGHLERAEEVLNRKANRYRKEFQAWIDLGHFYFKHKKSIKEARFTLQRALSNLKKSVEIVNVSSKFAQLEFSLGEPERGKSIFENIVRDFPSRTDQWMVYADMLIKSEQLEAARDLFQRMISLGLAPKKMKSLFKKYWEFEQIHGDQSKVDAVRKQALEYLERQNVDVNEDTEDLIEQMDES